MSDLVRMELLARLAELGRACPEMRFGQLIANLAVVARGVNPSAAWDTEDEELLAAVNWQLTELSAAGVRRSPSLFHGLHINRPRRLTFNAFRLHIQVPAIDHHPYQHRNQSHYNRSPYF